eukprot:GEMP01019700.1.p1 GENE.GEMP01019700.1~~GEMP01019700.1.p1  ORF type:complete len:836 (+),score=236.21 GEMP01019700.1:75-2582(+)
MIRVPRNQLIEVDVGERLTLEKVDDVMVSKDEPIRLPRELARISAPNVKKAMQGKIADKLDPNFFEEIWKRRAIETQQEILERQLSRSHIQQNELTKTLQSIAEALKPPPPPPVPEKKTEPPVVTPQFSSRDVLHEVQGNLEAAREDFKNGMQTLAKSLSAKLETSTTCSKREIEESLEAYMTRVQEEFRGIRLEVRSARQRSVTPPAECRQPAVDPPQAPAPHNLDLILDPPIRDFYDEIRLEVDQLHNEMNSLTWAADLSKRALRPKVLNAQMNATPILKKKTEPYSGKKVAVPGENVHLASMTRQVHMSTQRPRHLKDSGRKLLELPERIRPVRRENAIKSLKSRPFPPVTHHRATDHPATSSLSPPARRPQHSSVYRSPSPSYPIGYTTRLSPPRQNNFTEILARSVSATERAREDMAPCRPREVRDLQLLLPPADLFQLPVHEDARAVLEKTRRVDNDLMKTCGSGVEDDVALRDREKEMEACAAGDGNRVASDPATQRIEEQNSMLARILKECLPAAPKILDAKEVQTIGPPRDVATPEGPHHAVPTQEALPAALGDAPVKATHAPAVRKATPTAPMLRRTPTRTVGTQAQEKNQRPATKAKRKHKMDTDTIAPPAPLGAQVCPTYTPTLYASSPPDVPQMPVVVATPTPDAETLVMATSGASTTTPFVLRGHVVSHGPTRTPEAAAQVSQVENGGMDAQDGPRSMAARGQGDTGDGRGTIAVQTEARNAVESGTTTYASGRHEMEEGLGTSELRSRASRFEGLMLLGPTRPLKVDVTPSFSPSESLTFSLDKSSLFSDGECLYSVGEIPLSNMGRSEGEIASEFEFPI